MVLSWLGGRKSDHPLAEEKTAKETLAAIPKNDAEKALEEIRDWIVSVGATEDFKPERRAEVILLLDETALPHQRKLTRDYVSTPSLPKTQEARLWRALSAYWKDLATAYVGCLDQCAADSGAAGRLKVRLPLLCVRAMRALAGQLKWQYMHYEPSDPAVWEAIGRAYRFVEAKKLPGESVKLYPNTPQSSTAEREFLKLLMLAASSPDCLMQSEIELVEWVIAHLGAAFAIGAAHQPQSTYNYIDLSLGAPPKRLVQAAPASPTLRFFTAGAAAGQLDALLKIVEGGGIPSDLNLGGAYTTLQVQSALSHLKMSWMTPPPVRKSDRYEVQHRLVVANGMAGIMARVQGEPAQSGPESWVTQNISAGGVGAIVSNVQGDWLSVGRLVGLSVEGGSGACSVGIVRRWNRMPKLQSNVGILTLAKAAFVVTLGGIASQEAILLNDDRNLKDEVLLCLREGGFDKRIGPTLSFEGNNYLLVPIGIKHSGDGFDVARYRVMLQT
ncbi:MAG: hypothetical protein ACKVQK_20950 [Burkholderiales bacterium]